MRPRMAVLYGLLTRLGHQGMEPVSRGAPPGEANVMAVAKQVLAPPPLSSGVFCACSIVTCGFALSLTANAYHAMCDIETLMQQPAEQLLGPCLSIGHFSHMHQQASETGQDGNI